MGIIGTIRKKMSKKIMGLSIGLIAAIVLIGSYLIPQESKLNIAGIPAKIRGYEVALIDKIKGIIPKRA